MSSSMDGLTVLSWAVKEANSQGESGCLGDALAAPLLWLLWHRHCHVFP